MVTKSKTNGRMPFTKIQVENPDIDIHKPVLYIDPNFYGKGEGKCEYVCRLFLKPDALKRLSVIDPGFKEARKELGWFTHIMPGTKGDVLPIDGDDDLTYLKISIEGFNSKAGILDDVKWTVDSAAAVVCKRLHTNYAPDSVVQVVEKE